MQRRLAIVLELGIAAYLVLIVALSVVGASIVDWMYALDLIDVTRAVALSLAIVEVGLVILVVVLSRRIADGQPT